MSERERLREREREKASTNVPNALKKDQETRRGRRALERSMQREREHAGVQQHVIIR